jgi:hypothetical protein
MVQYSIGDGMVTLALAIGIVGWRWVDHHFKHKKDILRHEQRLLAMEKDIPLVELEEDDDDRRKAPDVPVMPVLGIVLTAFSFGAMVFLFFNLPPASKNMWAAPLPIAFMGVGLAGYHFLAERLKP